MGARIHEDPALAAPLVGDRPEVLAEAVHAVEHEMAFTVDDVLSRRVPLALRSRERAGQVVETVARVLASRLGWDEARIEREVAGYRRYLELEAEGFVEQGSVGNAA